MGTAIRKHAKDFIAIIVLIVVALVAGWIIVQNQRLRVPVIEERPFEMKAEFETAQAVVPGQGQTLRVAGVRVGDVAGVDLVDNKAVVTFAVDREFLPIYNNATILMRPQTGLKDMFFQLDPGSRAAGEIDEGGTIDLGNTAPDVNLDEILSLADADTRAYLRVLLDAGGQGLDGEGKRLGRILGDIGPINRDFQRLNSKVAQRKRELRRLVHNFRLVAEEAAKADVALTQLVSESNTAVGAIAERDPDVRRAISLLPGTLSDTRSALEQVAPFAAELGPTLNDLRPFARNLDGMNESLRELAIVATPAIEDQIRPFARAAQEPVSNLRPAARKLAESTPNLQIIGKKINRLGNMAAYNPNGAEPPNVADRDEGYLYWAAWLGHNGNSVFSTSDGNNLLRRIYFTVGCDQALNLLASSPLAPLVTNVGALFTPGGPFFDAC